MGETTYDIGSTSGSVPRTAMEPFAQALSERQLSLVRARLTANLGAAVAAWFRIVPSDQSPTGDLRLAALLLDAHLPILVPITEYEAGSSFFIARYDVSGQRVEMSGRGEMSRFSSLAEALLASDIAFRDLKYHAASYRGDQLPSAKTAELPEEHWLHEQLVSRLIDA